MSLRSGSTEIRNCQNIIGNVTHKTRTCNCNLQHVVLLQWKVKEFVNKQGGGRNKSKREKDGMYAEGLPKWDREDRFFWFFCGRK